MDLSGFPVGSGHVITAKARRAHADIASESLKLHTGTYRTKICAGMEGQDYYQDPGPGHCLSTNAAGAAPTAAGFKYLLYEDRDNGHAELAFWYVAGLAGLKTTWGAYMRLPEYQDPDKVVIANASLCYPVGSSCAGIVRYLMRAELTASEYETRYRENKFSWFPVHLDHDGIDLAWYMIPFINSSQGSSGSELDEVAKWVLALAALRPDTRDFLLKKRLLMPTMQMLFRRTRVSNDTAYLTGEAHANAFADSPNQGAMLQAANGITPDTAPSLVTLKVVSDDFSAQPIAGRSERALTTPTAIARIWQSPGDTPRRLTVQAEVADPNGRETLLHWSIIRGDPKYVTVTPMNADGSTANIVFGRHPEESITVAGKSIRTNLAVVAAFAHNGVYWSAPVFVTSFTGAQP